MILWELNKNSKGSSKFPKLQYHSKKTDEREKSWLEFFSALRSLTSMTPELKATLTFHGEIHEALTSNAAQALLMYIRSNVDKQFGDVVDQLVQHRTDTLCVGQPDDGPHILCHLQDICCPRTEIKRREAQRNWELYSIPNNLGIMAHNAEFNRLYQTFKHRGGVISSDEVVKQYFTSIYHVEERLLSQHVSRLYGEYEQNPASMSLFIIQAKMRDKEQEIQTNALARSKYGPSVKSSRANHAESKKKSPGKSKKSDEKKPSPNGKARDPSKVTCWGCNKVGHHLADCRSTPQNEKESIAKKRLDEYSKNKKTASAANVKVGDPAVPHSAAASMAFVYQAETNMAVASRHRRHSKFPIAKVNALKKQRNPGAYILLDYDEDGVLIDSGATDHMVGDSRYLTNIHNFFATVLLPDGNTIPVERAGTMRVRMFCLRRLTYFSVAFPETLLVPGLRAPLISVTRFAELGNQIAFNPDFIELTTNVNHDATRRSYRIKHPFYSRFQPTASTVASKARGPPGNHDGSDRTDPGSLSRERLRQSLPISPRTRNDEDGASTSGPQLVPSHDHEDCGRAKSNSGNHNQSTVRVMVEQLHHRMGHIPCRTLAVAAASGAWAPGTEVRFESDPYCVPCRMGTARSSNRGKSHATSPSSKPGSRLHLDITHCDALRSLSKDYSFKVYLGITDDASHAYHLVGMQGEDAQSVIGALKFFAVYHRPYPEYTLQNINSIHADAGSVFRSREFAQWCMSDSRSIRVETAAPHHQHQNGLTENRWKQTRLICNKMLSHARLGPEYMHFALLYAAMITNMVPLCGLSIQREGIPDPMPVTPFELYFKRKPIISRLRVFGCSCIFKAHIRGKLHDSNIIQRGVRGIWLGFPINQAGAIIWVGQVRRLIVSADYVCDENFESNVAYDRQLYHDGLSVRSVNPIPPLPSDRLAHTGPPLVTNTIEPNNDPWVPYTALPPEHPAPQPLFQDFPHTDCLAEEGGKLEIQITANQQVMTTLYGHPGTTLRQSPSQTTIATTETMSTIQTMTTLMTTRIAAVKCCRLLLHKMIATAMTQTLTTMNLSRLKKTSLHQLLPHHPPSVVSVRASFHGN
jgi:hypothetical protein